MIIYKIEQLENTKDLSHVVIAEEELKKLEELELTQLIIEDKGSYVIGLFTDEHINMLVYIFEKYQVKFSISDITSKFISSTPFVDMFRGKEKQIKSFIFNSISVNDVLDKINQSGIESLNEIDYLVLNK